MKAKPAATNNWLRIAYSIAQSGMIDNLDAGDPEIIYYKRAY
ncbi:hypothetical protein [Paenibacillus thiaminolyticus]|nr:hypothetical protein [Paenibacillus thiaminolyticus]